MLRAHLSFLFFSFHFLSYVWNSSILFRNVLFCSIHRLPKFPFVFSDCRARDPIFPLRLRP